MRRRDAVHTPIQDHTGVHACTDPVFTGPHTETTHIHMHASTHNQGAHYNTLVPLSTHMLEQLDVSLQRLELYIVEQHT